MLIDLVIENALVGILHLGLKQSLLFDLLLSHGPSLLLLLALHLFIHLLLLLFLDGEIGHVLLIYVGLLAKCCTLMRQVSLLIGTPWIILQLGHGGQIAARLA